MQKKYFLVLLCVSFMQLGAMENSQEQEQKERPTQTTQLSDSMNNQGQPVQNNSEYMESLLRWAILSGHPIKVVGNEDLGGDR